MQFNDTTNKNGLIQHAEVLCGLGDGGISGNAVLLKQFTNLMNQGYLQTAMKILASQDEWSFDDLNNTTYPVATAPLTTNRDFTLPTSLNALSITRVDVLYDGVTPYKAEPLDSGETGIPFGNDTVTDGYFSRSAPRYDIKFGSMWLYPKATAADVTAGGIIRIEYGRQITVFSVGATTTEPGIERTWHPMISLDAAYMWLLNNHPEKADRVKQNLLEMEQRMKQYYGSRQKDRRLQFQAEAVNMN